MPGDSPLPSHGACPNCQAALLGDWCHRCGQRRLEPADRRMTAILRELWAQWFGIDGKWLRSIASLWLQPGRLALDYAEGRRQRWLSPLSVFLAANLLFFLSPLLNDFNLPLGDQLSLQPWSAWARAWVDARLSVRAISLDAYAASYALVAAKVAPLAVLAHVPPLALALWAVFHRLRPLLIDQFALALHLVAGALVMYCVWPWLAVAASTLGIASEDSVMRLLLPLYALWAVLSLRGALQLRLWQLALGAPLILAALAFSHFFYRLLQFVIVQALI